MPLLQETISHHHGGCGYHGGFSLWEFRENHGGGVHHRPPGRRATVGESVLPGGKERQEKEKASEKGSK